MPIVNKDLQEQSFLQAEYIQHLTSFPEDVPYWIFEERFKSATVVGRRNPSSINGLKIFQEL